MNTKILSAWTVAAILLAISGVLVFIAGQDTTTPDTSVSDPVETICTQLDTNGDETLTLVDFASFARAYGKDCNIPLETNENIQYTINTPGFTDSTAQYVGVELKMQLSEGTVVEYIKPESGNWIGPIGTCDSDDAEVLTTSNTVCVALSKTEGTITPGESLGQIVFLSDDATSITIVSDGTIYSDGTSKFPVTDVSDTLTETQLSSGAIETTCGYVDTNEDGSVDIVDFASFARKYNKASCA
jgi:hypothetical protein